MSLTQDVQSLKLIDPTTARSLRERSGLTQTRIALELDVAPHTVQRWEAGTSRPRGGTRLRYARLLAELNEALAA